MVEEMNKPIKKIIAGSVSATIWSNKVTKDDKTFDLKSITTERSYTTDNGESWNSTNSMRVQDLPDLKLVVEEAYKYLKIKKE